MQRVVIDEPYEFIPPYRGKFWSWFFRAYLRRYLRKAYGVVEWECRGVERLRKSLDAGHGVILAPNHCRPSDPLALGIITIEANTHLYTMASFHVFRQDWWQTFVTRRLGAFSIYREGMDRQALNCAIDILETAERPLVVFPEGVITRTNDRLGVLMDGVAFIARTAAKRRAKADPAGRVVIHPVALKYHYLGDIEGTLTPVLEEIEHRLSWRPQRDLPIVNRIGKVGTALIGLKEVEYFGRTQDGSLYDRIERLIDHILNPLEREWLEEPQHGDVVSRVKKLRSAILPDLVDGNIDDDERDRRWRQLEDVYLAQQLWAYPRDYVTRNTPSERLLETVEKFEEDLTDETRVHGNLKLIMEIGEPIEVSPKRERGSNGSDPLMEQLGTSLSAIITDLANENGQA